MPRFVCGGCGVKRQRHTEIPADGLCRRCRGDEPYGVKTYECVECGERRRLKHDARARTLCLGCARGFRESAKRVSVEQWVDHFTRYGESFDLLVRALALHNLNHAQSGLAIPQWRRELRERRKRSVTRDVT